MQLQLDKAIEREAIRLTAQIAAGEDWAPTYQKAPTQHAKLIKAEAKLQVALQKYFNQLAVTAPSLINWPAYFGQVKADYNVDVIVQNIDQQQNQWDQALVTLTFDLVADMAAAGFNSGEVAYNTPLGISATSANIQKLTTAIVAKMVGKTVQDDGSIVDNPDAAYSVTDTLRNDIAQAIKTSLAMGENVQDATARIGKVIKDPIRAERIARTESINAYQGGLSQFASDSGAVGQEWQDAGATDVCADNTAEGPIPIDQTFVSGDSEPPAHVNCRCGRRLIYQQEWDQLGL